MDARECLLTRRSIRKYKSEPLSDELLNDILEPALAAPSAINLQHWHFVVVRTPQALAELKSIMVEVVERFNPVLKERFSKHPETIAQTQNFLLTLGGAPVCVLAFLLKEDYPDRDGAMQSVSAAVENLLLSAGRRELVPVGSRRPSGWGSVRKFEQGSRLTRESLWLRSRWVGPIRSPICQNVGKVA